MSLKASLKTWMTGLHYQPGSQLSPWLWPFLPLEWGYLLGVKVRLWAYQLGWLKSHAPMVPVISIGNLTTGGTGKTPIVVAIARGLIEAGKTVVVLSRGYGAEQPVDYGRALDPSHGDEAYMIQAQVPEAIVIVGRDRVHTLSRAIKDYRPDYVLLDDGFQYLRLKRAINILLIDGTRMLGNGHALPVGPLREPLSAIRRANIIFLTKKISQEGMAQVERWVQAHHSRKPAPQIVPVEFKSMGLRPLADFKSLHLHPISASSLSNRPVIAISAVAQPGIFEQELSHQGLRVLRHFAFEDHHVYTQANLAPILTLFEQHRAEQPILITTDKDLPKLRHLLPASVEPDVYTLQWLPHLDGRWFYDEFLTQMSGLQTEHYAHLSR